MVLCHAFVARFGPPFGKIDLDATLERYTDTSLLRHNALDRHGIKKNNDAPGVKFLLQFVHRAFLGDVKLSREGPFLVVKVSHRWRRRRVGRRISRRSPAAVHDLDGKKLFLLRCDWRSEETRHARITLLQNNPSLRPPLTTDRVWRGCHWNPMPYKHCPLIIEPEACRS